MAMSMCSTSGRMALPARAARQMSTSAVPRPAVAAPRMHAIALAPRLATSSRSGRRSLVIEASSSKTASTVKIVIQGRKLQVTDAIKSYIEDKISRALSNFTHTIKEVDVTISARGGDTGTHGKKEQKVDVTVYTLRNGVVRVEDAEDTLYASVDIVCDKLERKMMRVKEKAIAKGKWPGRAGDKSVGAAAEENEFKEYLQEIVYETKVFDREERLRQQFAELNKEYPATVRRTKVLALDPISVDEAIEAMEAVGHDFYVFREQESDSIQVVYRRQSEGYGVLIPRKRE